MGKHHSKFLPTAGKGRLVITSLEKSILSPGDCWVLELTAENVCLAAEVSLRRKDDEGQLAAMWQGVRITTFVFLNHLGLTFRRNKITEPK